MPFRLLEVAGGGGGGAGPRVSCVVPSRDPLPHLPLLPPLLSSAAPVVDDSPPPPPPPPSAASSPGVSKKVVSPFRFIPANYISFPDDREVDRFESIRSLGRINDDAWDARREGGTGAVELTLHPREQNRKGSRRERAQISHM